MVIEFEWQREVAGEVPGESDCICSEELAARLKAKLGMPAEDEALGPELHVFAADGRRIRVRRSQLTIH